MKAAAKGTSVRKYAQGQCRCCLKQDIHTAENAWEMLECLNIKMIADPRLSQLVCSDCRKFLRQARQFRDMVASSQEALLSVLQTSNSRNVQILTVKVEYDPGIGQKNEDKLECKLDKMFPTPNTSKREQDTTNINVLKKYLTSDPTIGLHSTVKQEHQEEDESSCGETKGVTVTEATVIDDRIPDDGRMEQDQGSSDLSDDAFENDVKENNEEQTPKELKNIEKWMEAKYNAQIRENLCTILQNSTIVPFTITKGLNDCIYCSNKYKHFKELRHHVETKHNGIIEIKNQALKLYALKHDMDIILNADISCIRCKMCCKRFVTIDNLVEHLVCAHEKPYHKLSRDPPHNILCFDMSLDCLRCLDCGKTFTHFRGLLMHMNQHYGSYLCPECGSKFLHERSYKIHLAQESKRALGRPVCSVCGSTFSMNSHLRRHMITKHPQDTELR